MSKTLKLYKALRKTGKTEEAAIYLVAEVLRRERGILLMTAVSIVEDLVDNTNHRPSTRQEVLDLKDTHG